MYTVITTTKPGEPPPEFLTIDEAAALFRLHPETIRRHLQSGDLKGSKAARNWRIRRSDLDAWYEKHVQKETSSHE